MSVIVFLLTVAFFNCGTNGEQTVSIPDLDSSFFDSLGMKTPFKCVQNNQTNACEAKKGVEGADCRWTTNYEGNRLCVDINTVDQRSFTELRRTMVTFQKYRSYYLNKNKSVEEFTPDYKSVCLTYKDDDDKLQLIDIFCVSGAHGECLRREDNSEEFVCKYDEKRFTIAESETRKVGDSELVLYHREAFTAGNEDNLLLAVDGTWSKKFFEDDGDGNDDWSPCKIVLEKSRCPERIGKKYYASLESKGDMKWIWSSHVANWADTYSGTTKYWYGPDDGTKTHIAYEECAEIADWAVNEACEFLKEHPNGQIDVIGFSRGGWTAMLIAQALNAGCDPDNSKPVPVRFLGLFDPVKMTTKSSMSFNPIKLSKHIEELWDKQQGAIPENVQNVWVAERGDHLSHTSWSFRKAVSSFKNKTACPIKGSCVMTYTDATHGGVGGMTNDNDCCLWSELCPVKCVGYDNMKDRIQSVEIDKTMRAKGYGVGVPIEIQDDDYYRGTNGEYQVLYQYERPNINSIGTCDVTSA